MISDHTRALSSTYRVGRHTQMDRRPVGKSHLGQYWVAYITSTAGTRQGTLATTDFPTVDEDFDHDTHLLQKSKTKPEGNHTQIAILSIGPFGKTNWCQSLFQTQVSAFSSNDLCLRWRPRAATAAPFACKVPVSRCDCPGRLGLPAPRGPNGGGRSNEQSPAGRRGIALLFYCARFG
jgi:hypothetical protein